MDILAREVVRRRLSVRGEPPEHPSFVDVWQEMQSEGLPVFSEADARKLYRRAVENGLVSIRVTNERVKASPLWEDDELSAALTQLGRRGLGSVDFRAHVLDTSEVDDGAGDGDRIHELLGWTAGTSWLAGELTNDDLLALTGGRAVVAAVDGLIETRGLHGVSVYAITGSSQQGTGRVAGASLDADSVVRRILADAGPERRPEKVLLMTLPLALEPDVMERDDPDGFLRRISQPIHEDWWRARRPAVTLLGIARVDPVLTPNHPLFVSKNPFLAPQLDELATLLDRHRDDGLVIAEMCHQLWVARQPPPGRDRRKVAELCQSLNSRLLAPTYRSLSHGRRRVVIGGGPHKVEAIASLLTGGTAPFEPSLLYTDTATARTIVDAARPKRRSPPRRSR